MMFKHNPPCDHSLKAGEFGLSESVRISNSPDGGTVLDIERGQVFTVNVVGSRILEMLRQGHDKTNIANKISEEFHVARNTAEADLSDFLAALERKGLMEGGIPET